MSPPHHELARLLPYPQPHSHPPALPPQHRSVNCQATDRLCCRNDRCIQRKPYVYPIPPSSSKTSTSGHNEIDRNNNKIEKDSSNVEKSPVEMLTRLFPQHPFPILKNVLADCNDDTVRAIEQILDRYPGTNKDLESQTARVHSPSPPINDQASNEKRSVRLNDEQLSSLARAYDIPVVEEKSTTSKRSMYPW